MQTQSHWTTRSAHLSLVEPDWQADAAHPLLQLPQPYALLRGDRWLLLANEGARPLLELEGGRVRRIGSLPSVQLEALMRLALGGTPSRTPLHFPPAPLTGALGVQRLSAALRDAWDAPADCLLLSLQQDDPAQLHTARLEALCARSGLTPAERCVLMLLGDGIAPEAAALQLGVRISTLRSHVRHLLAKTQSRSLLQLLRWLGSSEALPG